VERTDQTAYSLPRGLSANGEWLVTSRTLGADLELTLREVGSSDPGVVVGSTPNFVSFRPYPVAVSDNGDVVSFEGRRWLRSTNAVSPLTPPVAGATYRFSSSDATRAVWRIDGQSRFWVTDALDDVDLGWTGVAAPSSQGKSLNSRFDGGYRENPVLTDYSDGSTRSIADAYAQTATARPSLAMGVSNDGSFVLLSGLGADPGGPLTPRLWTYEVETGVLRTTALGQFERYNIAVADNGRVLLGDSSGALLGPDRIREVQLDGSVRLVNTGSLLQPLMPGSDDPLFVTTPDGRSVAFTAFTGAAPPTSDLTVSRCR